MAASDVRNAVPQLADDAREEAGQLLQLTLVELIALSLIGKQLHWNITGTGFRDLHLQLDELVDEWRELSDVVAERAVAVGFSPGGRATTGVGPGGVGPVEAGRAALPEAIRQLA